MHLIYRRLALVLPNCICASNYIRLLLLLLGSLLSSVHILTSVLCSHTHFCPLYIINSIYFMSS